MNEIKRIIMGYAWEVAKREAKKEGCSARECFAWALSKAWKEFKHCDRCAFDISSVMEAVEEYEKEENFKKCPYCLDDARNRQRLVYSVSGEMPTLIYAFSGVKRGC